MASKALALRPEQQEADKVSAPLAEYVSDEAKAFVIANDEDMHWVEEQLLAVRTINDKLVAALSSVTKPMREAESTLRSWFKPKFDMAEAAIVLLTEKIIEYRAYKAMGVIAATQLVNDGARDQQTIDDMLPAEDPDLFDVRRKWRWSVLNVDIVPTQFTGVVVNEEAVDTYLKDFIKKFPYDHPAISGISFNLEESLAKKRTAK